MSASNRKPFSPSTSGKAPATPPNPNPKIKQRRAQFPPDLSEEILLRLGVKSLLRFKCVSRQWFSLLSNQQFITKHLKIQTAIRACQEFIVQGLEDANFAIGTLDDNADRIRFRLLETNHLEVLPSEKSAGLLGHCNGLLSVRFYSKGTDRNSVAVWNPSTMEQWRFLMPQCLNKNVELFGFGFDSVSDDYKLVLATITAYGNKLGKIQSLSLKRGLWKTVQFDVDYSFDLSDGAHVNGYIYWLINREQRSSCGIVSFDLSTDKLREEESLSWILSNKSNMYSGLKLSGESLCLVESLDEVTYDVWMMEENVVTHTKFWIKLFRVSSTDGNFNTPLNDPWNRDVMTPVCFTRDGKVLIYWHSRYEYALYNPDDQSVNKVAEFGNPILESWPVSPYVESLVSLG